MSREVRRVPVDFDWPLNEVWEGYLTPERLRENPCEVCGQSGSTDARKAVEKTAYLLLMLDDDREDQVRGRPMHPYFGGFFYGPRPSADIAEFGRGLAGREGGWGGHDGIDQWKALKKIIEAAGLDPEVWGICPACEGHGATEKYPGQRAEAEAWQWTEPPTGEGWQYWETVSEGSPISPVFPTAEGLKVWLTTEYQPVGGGRLTPEQAGKTVEMGGTIGSGIITNAGVFPNEKAWSA